ncbi:hypothetical protein LFL96_30165 [Paraburkholderia sp. D15]|uniref:hypothetical protein n=1 Tax=Paraburkholderia sp. D15 TaxID=2880218 RepID=UPI00247AB785|nr:hypothetical protein [Paraburkholderia sp. D15]WGS52458.1 hypothetical protein LFL96_30165 [Paraburkholderia sp. D15]
MTLPELFRHRDLFVGCLAIGRVPRRRAGERLRAGLHEQVLDDAHAASVDSIADATLHRAGDTFSIVVQGYDYSSLARCPALEDDGRCGIHFDRKPVTCEVVPLDPLLPDSLQHLVLAGRNQSAHFLGAECIQPGVRDDAPLLVAEGRVEDANARDALARRRHQLEREKAVWGRAVFESLRRELFESPAALARIPAGGFLTISLVPALLAVAGASERCRQGCIDFIDSQLGLIERRIADALLRRRLDDRPVTQTLRGFAGAYQRAKALLNTPLDRRGEHEHVENAGVEDYLFGVQP